MLFIMSALQYCTLCHAIWKLYELLSYVGLKKLWFNSILMLAFHSMSRLGMLTYLPDKHFNHISCTCVCYFPWQVISQVVKSTPSISKGSRKFFRTLQNNGIFNICIMLFVKQNYMYLHCCNMFCGLENRCCIGHHPHIQIFLNMQLFLSASGKFGNEYG